jgi:hydrogenase maturation protease
MNVLSQNKKTLLIGIGNDGRSDDAMGWKFLDELSGMQNMYDFEYRYQLQIEDAELVSNYDQVIFVDACHQQWENGFSFYRCHPEPTSSFTTHQLTPETVLWLAGELFNDPPQGYVMAISGIHWKLHNGLSNKAKENFIKAISYFKKMEHRSIA